MRKNCSEEPQNNNGESPIKSYQSIILQSMTQINPFLNRIRKNSCEHQFEHGFFQTSDKYQLFYRKWIPKDADHIEKIVFCIHGLHSHGEKFVILADYFYEQNWLTIALDLRGHGLSAKISQNMGDIKDYRIWIRDLIEFWNQICLDYPETPIFLIGESMGGGLAVHLAITHPQNLKSVILISPALIPIREIQVAMGLRSFLYGLFDPSLKPVIRNKARGRLTSNSEVFLDYEEIDPLRLTNVSPRYYYQVLRMLNQLKKYHHYYRDFYSTCIFYGENDHLIDFEGPKKFINIVNNTEKALHYIPLAFHELLTDLHAIKYGIYIKMVRWIRDH
jgi:alpha-beta hydrolase superfamily lysophospholipase